MINCQEVYCNNCNDFVKSLCCGQSWLNNGIGSIGSAKSKYNIILYYNTVAVRALPTWHVTQ